MAIRNIRTIGDSVLTKKAKEITVVDDKLTMLIEDMLDTMYEAEGVGLAAPQVGILKRVVVIDCSPEGNEPVVLINPEIVETSGEQTGTEGCLSVPGKVGVVTRPNYCKVRALNKELEPFEIEGEELMARALLHEIDHLDGHLYVDKVEGALMNVEDLMKEEE